MAGASGLGSIGTANQLGQVGQQYANQATSPNATQAYMSPYMQNVVDVQKNEAFRDAQMRNIGANLGSARQGTYGGARQLLGEQERNRNLQQGLANIQATGTQNAFQDAQRSQQFGANLGLQGLQTGITGQQAGMQGAGVGLQGVGTQLAGTSQGMQGAQVGLQGVSGAQAGYQGAINAANSLSGIGSSQNQSTLANLQMQNQFGAQQQAPEQQKINQQIQDYATQQQYPYMQLGIMNAMLRGLPLQSTSTQSYQAQPSTGQQLMGYGLGALGAYKAFS